MKLKDYLDFLNNLVLKNPELLTLDLYTADDPEGNNYTSMTSYPSICYTIKESQMYYLDFVCQEYELKEYVDDNFYRSDYNTYEEYNQALNDYKKNKLIKIMVLN